RDPTDKKYYIVDVVNSTLIYKATALILIRGVTELVSHKGRPYSVRLQIAQSTYTLLNPAPFTFVPNWDAVWHSLVEQDPLWALDQIIKNLENS
ncbi:MAG: hypothetical protein ACPGO7_01085, partial [Alphaproteobacteria bacterium]